MIKYRFLAVYFIRFWAICVLQLFVDQADVVSFEINLIFLIKLLFRQNSRQKIKYLENKKKL